MSVSGFAPTLAASYYSAGGSARASVNGMSGAAGHGSVGPAAVLDIRGRSSGPIIQTISQLLKQELEQGSIDLAA